MVAGVNATLHSGDQEPVRRLDHWILKGQRGLFYDVFERVVALRTATTWASAFTDPCFVKSGNEEFVRLPSNDWYYKGIVYETEGPHSEEEFKLLVKEEFDRERRLFERLRHKHEGGDVDEGYSRQPIPESVRIEVWRRDAGKCARCGSRESLEYDHIVPVSKGGSNTARNIELLCEQCNRTKGATIC